jgi:hypothetical protein
VFPERLGFLRRRDAQLKEAIVLNRGDIIIRKRGELRMTPVKVGHIQKTGAYPEYR